MHHTAQPHAPARYRYQPAAPRLGDQRHAAIRNDGTQHHRKHHDETRHDETGAQPTC